MKWIKDLTNKEVIHAPTEEIAKKLCCKFHELGLQWCDNKKYNIKSNWNAYTNRMCYLPLEGEFCSKDWYLSKGCKIYTINDLLDFNEEFILPEKWYIEGGYELIGFLKEEKTCWVGNSIGYGYYLIKNEWEFIKIDELLEQGYIEITVEQYKKSIMREEKGIIFTVQNQKDTIEMSCEVWRKKLAKLFGYTIALNKKYECSKEQFDEFLKASTEAQRKKFQKMFPVYFQPKIEKDTLVYVKGNIDELWKMRYFSHFDLKGQMYCYNKQKTSKETNLSFSWNFYSLTNPLIG